MNPVAPHLTLLTRAREELAALFDFAVPATAASAPACVDVIGGLLVGHGGTRVLAPINRHASALAQPRTDRQILVFDFNEYDEHRPFTLQIGAHALADAPEAELRRNFAEPGRRFAEPAIDAVRRLHRAGALDLHSPSFTGLNLAVWREASIPSSEPFAPILAALLAVAGTTGTPPADVAGVASRGGFDPAEVFAALNGSARSLVVATPTQTSTVALPEGVRIGTLDVEAAIDPAVRLRIGSAARLAHWLILQKMSAFGREAGRELVSDPMDGRLGNLALSDYKRFFRGTLPESLRGQAFLDRYPDAGIDLDPDVDYAPQLVADHLVIESHRAAEFVRYIEEAAREPEAHRRGLALDKSGHLLYASHKSARDNCGFGGDAADGIVDLARRNERAGFHGGRIAVSSAGCAVLLCGPTLTPEAAETALRRESGAFAWAGRGAEVWSIP